MDRNVGRRTVALAVLAAIGLAMSAQAHAFTLEQRCIRAKYQAWEKYIACRNKVRFRILIGVGSVGDLAKCEAQRVDRMQRAAQIASCKLIDNGDETVTDLDLGVMWEKKTATNVGDGYDWTVAMTDYLAGLNGMLSSSNPPSGTPSFAGHTDWRLPSIGEIGTMMNGVCTGPCTDPVLGPVAGGPHWTSTASSDDPSQAWTVSDNGSSALVADEPKTSALVVRAVRTAFP